MRLSRNLIACINGTTVSENNSHAKERALWVKSYITCWKDSKCISNAEVAALCGRDDVAAEPSAFFGIFYFFHFP